jgi:hypothetical protein
VVERGEHLRLALEARETLRIGGERVGEDFDRDLAAEGRIGRAPDLPIPPTPSFSPRR